MDKSEQKKELRKKKLSERIAIPDSDWSRRSALILDSVLNLPEYQKAEIIHCFISMNQRKEVNTHELISNALESNKKVIAPISDFDTNTLKHSLISDLGKLKENKWGVLEPDSEAITKAKAEVIFVPLLCADKRFNRLGYGKGFYDRFLKDNEALKIGLLFDEFILEEIPVEHFDEKLDILVTDKSVYRRNNEEIAS